MKKSLIIKKEVHIMLKEHCDKKGLKLSWLVEDLIIKYIEDERKNKNIPN
jgi:hypothetical protein